MGRMGVIVFYMGMERERMREREREALLLLSLCCLSLSLSLSLSVLCVCQCTVVRLPVTQPPNKINTPNSPHSYPQNATTPPTGLLNNHGAVEQQVGDGHAASSESKTAGGADRRRRFAVELKKILDSGGDVAVPPKGDRASLLEVAAGAVSGLSRACSGEMQVCALRGEMWDRRPG